MTSELPLSSPYRSTPDAAVGEDERNRVVSRLNAAYEAGQLETEDYQARLDRLFAAQRLGELVPVVQGLPPLRTHTEPALVTGDRGQPGELAPARSAAPLALVAVGLVVVGIVVVLLLLLT